MLQKKELELLCYLICANLFLPWFPLARVSMHNSLLICKYTVRRISPVVTNIHFCSYASETNTAVNNYLLTHYKIKVCFIFSYFVYRPSTGIMKAGEDFLMIHNQLVLQLLTKQKEIKTTVTKECFVILMFLL